MRSLSTAHELKAAASTALAGQLCASGTVGHVHQPLSPGLDTVVASVCCPGQCDRCGGVDCWAQAGGLACCAAHVHALGAPPCSRAEDVGCVLPHPAADELPAELREESCLDVWSAVFPGEAGDWRGRSCDFKVKWGQCSQFYSSCQCSCGYCLPTHDHGCSPSGGEALSEAPPPPAESLLPMPTTGAETSSSSGSSSKSPLLLRTSTSSGLQQPHPLVWLDVQLPPSPPLPSPLPTGKESIGSAATGTLGPTPTSSMLVATLAWAVATLAEGGPVSPEAAGVLAAALLVICLLCRVAAACCRVASRPDAPLWLQACSHACCGALFLGHAAIPHGRHSIGPTHGAAYTSVHTNGSVIGSGVRGGAHRAAAAAAALEEEEDEEYDDERFIDVDDGWDEGWDEAGCTGTRASSCCHRSTASLRASSASKQQSRSVGGRGSGGRGGGGGGAAAAAAATGGSEDGLEYDARDIYDAPGLDEMPDLEDDIRPDDSISVAYFKTLEGSGAKPPLHGESVREGEGGGGAGAATMTIEVPNTTPGTSEMPNTTPATIEAPNGSLHAMDVELDGLTSTAELRRGMLQGYRELLGVQLPPHALRVHARLRSGSSVLLTDETPLSSTVLEAVAFYVWAVLSPDDMRSIKPA